MSFQPIYGRATIDVKNLFGTKSGRILRVFVIRDDRALRSLRLGS